MGNTIGGKSRKAKVMKISGETFKVKTPIRAGDVVKEHPGHMLLNSEAVKHFGMRAKPLEAQQELKPRSIYFLVELPNFDYMNSEEEAGRRSNSRVARRVRSSANIQVSAKERLECLMLSRRSASDLTSLVRAAPPSLGGAGGGGGAPVRMKMRLPRAQVVKLMEESKDEIEVADKIIQLYMATAGTVGDDSNTDKNFTFKAHQKRVSFVPEKKGEIQLDVAPQ
ncbi:hypothetical protein RchiOBHm_Chr3g0493541 [Rosa chinensis]|uniref:Plastid movement impaired protein n=1 Tax=Rosa chinensis TaxID=74649 RepID=A0A2P6RGS9_ROSCH|nr:uncharacterized protein At1g66480 [Rosa chinensis]PRQ45629.1 hypothetical protein RchiOBHm_Chr3g0493541 [Rosa chinensis]